MNGVVLGFGLLLFTQVVGGDATQVPVSASQPRQLPPLKTEVPATPAWKTTAEATPASEPAIPAREAAPASAAGATPAQSVAPPARLPDPAASPPELLAEALDNREGGPRGEPLSLSAALSATSERGQQTEVVHTYWRLVLAVGRANLIVDLRTRLAQHEAAGGGLPLWKSARASATAQAEEAAAEVVSLQHELAALLSRSPETPLPLPSDSPHVGPYATHFDRLRSAGRAPASALVIDRRLSILWQAIEARAAAAATANDAFLAASAAASSGAADMATVIETAEQAHRQQRELLEVVIRYNRDIAGYALLVAPPGTAGSGLVQMLIEQPAEPLRPIPAEPSLVQPAAAMEPAGRPRTSAAPPATVPSVSPRTRPLDPRRPTRAVRPDTQSAPASEPNRKAGSQVEPPPAAVPDEGGAQLPAQAVPDNGAPPATPKEAPAPAEPAGQPVDNSEDNLPSLITPPSENRQPPGDETRPASDAEAQSSPRPVVPVTPTTEPVDAAVPADTLGLSSLRPPKGLAATGSDGPPRASHAAFRLDQLDSQSTASFTPSLYGPLLETSPGRRAKQLALTLHWDRTLPEGSGEPLDLASCLGRCRAEDRSKLLAVYWKVREAAARYQVLAEHATWLRAIAGDTPSAPSSQPTAAELHLQSVCMAARAETHEAHAALVQAQFDLAVLLGRSIEDVWPMASSPPHSGTYLPKLDAQPAEVAASPVVRRRASVLPRLGEAVQQYATAVVEADAARVETAQRFAAGEASLDAMCRAVDRQTDQTLAFLRALTDYNRAIAAYALAVLPLEVPAETLVSALVVQ